MNANSRFLTAVAVLALLVSGPFLLTALIVWSESRPEQQAQLVELLGPHAPLGGLLTAVAFVIGVVVIRKLFRHYVKGLLGMAEQQRLMLNANRDFRLEPVGPPEVQALATSVNELADQRDALLRDVEAQISAARRDVEDERNRLAALMAQLAQSVVVCNLDGRILLYNPRARALCRAAEDTPRLSAGADLVGLGRSIYGVFDRNLLLHALDAIQHRIASGAAELQDTFVTTSPRGQLLRMQMAPVLAVQDEEETQEATGESEEGVVAPPPVMTGFILMFDDITQTVDAETSRGQMLVQLTEGNRAALANMRAAAEMLEFPDLDEALRARFSTVIRDEVQAMSDRLDRSASEFTALLKARWPLEDIAGADLVAAVQRRIVSTLGIPVHIDGIEDGVWTKVDSYSLVQAITFLASRLIDEFEVRNLALRVTSSERRVQFDLIWQGRAMSTETVMNWELEGIRVGSEASPLTVRDVIDRHDGEIWLEREKVRHRAFFRILLPQATPHAAPLLPNGVTLRGESRPEYFDFDLFKWSESERAHALDDRLLPELTYTVFDTETTGLHPAQGDEIIQFGALRVVNGKLLRQEVFEQLVDPQRPLSPESIAIHGIQPEMLEGQPTIVSVLPAFKSFVADTVLIAHNAAFDMRFLQLKEASTGVVFDNPVLDTLLLSAVIHPNQESHRLEAIVERLNLKIMGRHTALGDAMVTAEVFLRMIPLLADMGIRTLREAREAAEKTYYARVKY